MNRKFLVLALVIAALFTLSLATTNAQGKMTKVRNDWGGYAYYLRTGSGTVHEWWSCNADWTNCVGDATYFPLSKFAEPPECEAYQNGRLLAWNGTVEYGGDEGNLSGDFLQIGQSYWFCDSLGSGEVFRAIGQ